MLVATRTLGTVYRRSVGMSNISWRRSISVIAASSAPNSKDSPAMKTRPFVPGTPLPSSFQVRSMGSKKKKKKNKGAGSNPDSKAVQFKLVSEVGEDDIKASNMGEVCQMVAETLEVDVESLDIGDLTLQIGVPEEGSEWQEFKSFDQVKDLQQEYEGKTLSLRIKEFTDDEDDDDDYNPDSDDDDYDLDNDYGANEGQQGNLMKVTFTTLMREMKDDGWVLPDDAGAAAAAAVTEAKLTRNKDGIVEEASTRELVLRYAEHDPELQDVLVMRIGALDHISKCLQFGFLWKELLGSDEDDDEPAPQFDDEDPNEEIDEAAYDDIDDKSKEDIDDAPNHEKTS